MALNLIKLCVGCESIQELEGWIKQRMKEKRKRGEKPEHIHRTRMVPKRAAELVDGGSLYWVIRGEIACRQRIRDLRPFRAFQGWRYLAIKDAPPDLEKAARGMKAMPEKLRRELRELGLI